MDARKDYVAPAIAAEDDLEQTSLACHATMPYPMIGATCFAGEIQPPNYAYWCETDVSKGGALDLECNVVLRSPKDIVVLS